MTLARMFHHRRTLAVLGIGWKVAYFVYKPLDNVHECLISIGHGKLYNSR